MSYLTRQTLNRRTVLKGLGVSVSLPLLEAMIPARAADAQQVVGKKRFVAIEMVHGSAGSTAFGEKNHLWAPAETGRNYTFGKSSLAPLEAYRDHLTIVSRTDVRNAEAFTPPEIGGDHFRSAAVFLTQSHPHQTQGSDVRAGVSIDQIFANQVGGETPIPSMQLCIENVDQAGGCFYGYSCAYTDSISWSSPNEPLPMIRDPRVAFDLLFGAGSSARDRALRRENRRSILDWIQGEVASVRQELGVSDRQRLDRYLDNVREIERRIQAIEAQNSTGEQRALPDAPKGVPDSFSEHMRLLFDLQVLALQSNMTRVISFKTGRDSQNRVFPESGSSQPFHPASHHGNREDRIMEFNKICKYRVSQVGYLLEKLKSATEGDQTLLDKTMIVWGSPMADANVHNHRRCPLVLFGKANGALKGNLHLKAPDGTPMANAMLTMLNELGLDDLKSFGDSTGNFSLTSPSVSTVVA
jgi:hypothetical protein